MLPYSGGFKKAAAEVAEMEKAGLDLVWVAEVYGFDSPSLMGYLAALTEKVEIGAAILPIYTRTPTLLAMTAAGIDALSDGKLHFAVARRSGHGSRQTAEDHCPPRAQRDPYLDRLAG